MEVLVALGKGCKKVWLKEYFIKCRKSASQICVNCFSLFRTELSG